MGCNCHPTVKRDFEKVKELAIKTAVINEEDIQIYTFAQRGVGDDLYDYEPLGFQKRVKSLVEVIRFRDHKGKDVLRDSKPDAKIKKNSGGGTKKRKSNGGKPNEKLDRIPKLDAEIDELTKDWSGIGWSGDAEVDGDSKGLPQEVE